MFGYSARTIRNACIKLITRHDIKAFRLLDIGGSTGEFTKIIAGLVEAKEVFIADLSHESLSVASKLGFKTLHINASADELPFPDGTLDMILMIELIEHLTNPDHCIKECRRILKNNGLLFLATPNLVWWINRLAMVFGYQPYYSEPSSKINVGKFRRKVQPFNTSGHIRLFTFKAIIDFLDYYGFKVLDYIGAPGEHRNKFLRIVDGILSKRSPLAADIGVLAAKNRNATN